MGIVTEEEKEAQNRFRCSFVEHTEEEREKQRERAAGFMYSCYLGGRIWPELATLLGFACLCVPVLLLLLCGGFSFIHLPLNSLSIIHL